MFKVSITLFLSFMLCSCAYHMGHGDRALPGNYKSLFIPVVKNSIQETGVEMAFTSHLREEFFRSKLVSVKDKKDKAEAVLKVDIINLSYVQEGQSVEIPHLPDNSALTTQYRVLLTARYNLIDSKTNTVVFSGVVKEEDVYTAPKVATLVINSVNANYNESAKRNILDVIAKKMMSEVHNRLVERF